MKHRLILDDPATYVLVFEAGDEVMPLLEAFASGEPLDAAEISAIGAFERVTLAYFDWATKQYEEIPIDEQVEVLSLLGNVTSADGKPKIHLHGVVGRRDGSTAGGHLMKGTVRPTLEMVITESPAHLRRVSDEETGLALIAPQA